ncbi:MAG: aminoglycoside phosphotransferase family protein [Chitinophagaceae bacterium]|nr:aminoglycoside phosphotransferase family protein [Chitinophagaceae bacterium]
MEGRSEKDIAHFSKLARQLMKHHFPKKTLKISPLGGGLTNYVFSVGAGKTEMVVRISDLPEKIHFFQKEQWAVARAKEKGIPVPQILEVGNDIIPFPYMISNKITGEESTHHKNRLQIIREMGRYAAVLHTIPTKGFGHLFDWSQNTLSKNQTWKDYLQCELNADARLAVLNRHKMILPKISRVIKKELINIRKWRQSPCLHHGDIRLKNTMVDKDGKILAIIDWENCVSSIGPFWDTSIALHDLSIEAQWQYLEGYGMKSKQLLGYALPLKIFNILNYAPVIEKLSMEKQKETLEHYRARLKGALDMFSLLS